jgi:hypothetical protein
VFIIPFKEKQHIFIKTCTQVPIIIEFVFLLRTVYSIHIIIYVGIRLSTVYIIQYIMHAFSIQVDTSQNCHGPHDLKSTLAIFNGRIES